MYYCSHGALASAYYVLRSNMILVQILRRIAGFNLKMKAQAELESESEDRDSTNDDFHRDEFLVRNRLPLACRQRYDATRQALAGIGLVFCGRVRVCRGPQKRITAQSALTNRRQSLALPAI